MSLFAAALKCIARGWHVFPCRPKTKTPAVQGGFHAATTDESKVREWWTRWPDANVGIATGASGLTVLDVDSGVTGDDFHLWFARTFPGVESYAVRTGRRPGFGVQVYFRGGDLKSIPWEDGGLSGDIRSGSGYVMAEGSTHPSGEPYTRLQGHPDAIGDTPAYVRNLRSAAKANAAVADDGGMIESHRNATLVSILGRFRNGGADDDDVLAKAEKLNATRVSPPLGEEELSRIVANVCRYPVGRPEPEVVLGGAERGAHGALGDAKHDPYAGNGVEAPRDWRTLFHTREETENTPDPEFLIEGFLQTESLTGLIGPARARKSIVTLNIIRSLLTGEKLFGRFDVPNKPERVVYLCPESGIKSLGRRIRNTGLAEYVGESLFFTSMNSDPVKLDDPVLREAARGSVLFIDTFIRFYSGNENDSSDMRPFGDLCQALIRDGVRAIVLLHHTGKGTETVTLESGRGSGDFGGFLTCCWGTSLDDYEEAYTSQSLLTCVKQRDFRADSFKVAPSGDEDNFLLQYVEGSENARVTVGAKEKPGKAKALAFIRANPGMTAEKTRQALEAQGIRYGVSAIGNMLREARALSVGEA